MKEKKPHTRDDDEKGFTTKMNREMTKKKWFKNFNLCNEYKKKS